MNLLWDERSIGLKIPRSRCAATQMFVIIDAKTNVFWQNKTNGHISSGMNLTKFSKKIKTFVEMSFSTKTIASFKTSKTFFKTIQGFNIPGKIHLYNKLTAVKGI